jgi:cytochrome c oxidase cbb3-type subunit III
MSRLAADRASDHRYDGIEEYDNPLPGWWVWIFWATIAFSALYWAYYQVGPGPSVIQVYDAEVKAAAEAQARRAPPAPAEGTDAEIAALSRDGARMAEARQTFETRCAVCHGPQGQGIIGPNLTDDYFIHGQRPTDLAKVIGEGVVDKGMIPWKDQLSPAEIRAVAAYVLTLQGTTPPNPKPPQGVNSKGEAAPDAQASR